MDARLQPPPGPPEFGQVPACRRWVTVSLWGPIYGLVVLGLLCLRMGGDPAPVNVPPLAIRVVLGPFDPPRFAPEPGRLPGPSGGSHRLGSGTIDVRLLELPALETVRTPPERILPILEPEILPAVPPLALDKSLPVHAGGNGVPRGDGAGFGRGHGDGVGPGSGRDGKGILKLLRSVSPQYPTGTYDAPIDGQSVRVKLQVSAEGLPIRAAVVGGRGRQSTFAAIVQAALQWRFEVQKEFAGLAPFEVLVEFTYRQEASRKGNLDQVTEVLELKPVELR